jgi:hypothetical protein
VWAPVQLPQGDTEFSGKKIKGRIKENHDIVKPIDVGM